ncbi:MAG: divalent metal cation transporter [Planctomycetota bacterium]
MADQQGTNRRSVLSCIGPGLLLAGAAIGVSHLIQSTRAGANFGFGLLGVLIVACITKYPFLEFGPRYASATGEDLVEGYRRLGAWAVWLAALVTLGSMFIVMAAVTAVTASVAKFIAESYLPGLGSMPMVAWASVVIAACLAVLLFGRYRALERFMKVVMVVLLVSTVAAVLAVLFGRGEAPPVEAAAESAPWWALANLGFLLAFMGWMPIPIDSAIWNSIWVQEHARACSEGMTRREACLDFRIGYIGAGIVAVLFVSLGALMMHGRVTELADGAGFVNQLIGLYADTLGGWSVPIIAAAALTTMFSTTLVVLDAFPRAMHRITQAARGAEPAPSRFGYYAWVLAQASVSILILEFFSGGMKAMVDLATTLSFLTAPVLALMNYLVVTRHTPGEARPGRGLRCWSWCSIGFLGAFGATYLAWALSR